MTTLDWLIAVLVVFLAVRGLGTGFLVGVLSFGGTFAGVYLGSRIASSLVFEGLPAAYGALIVLLIVLVSAVLGEAGARLLGTRLRLGLLRTPLEPLDRVAGVALGAAIGLVIVWIVGIVGQQAPIPPALQASLQQSVILGELDKRLPSRALLQAFARFDPLPQLPGPRPEVPNPDPALLNEPGVRQAASSVVRVTSVVGTYGTVGSGWVAASGLVVTNAHVVADANYAAVQPEGVGERLVAEILVLDQRNDVAVLGVENLNLPPLQTTAPQPGEPVAILGYPENGPFDARAGRVGETQLMLTSDAYGGGIVERQVTSLLGPARRGNSGGPVVNSSGQVVATVFAARIGVEGISYGIPSPIVETSIRAAEEHGAPAAVSDATHMDSRVDFQVSDLVLLPLQRVLPSGDPCACRNGGRWAACGHWVHHGAVCGGVGL